MSVVVPFFATVVVRETIQLHFMHVSIAGYKTEACLVVLSSESVCKDVVGLVKVRQANGIKSILKLDWLFQLHDGDVVMSLMVVLGMTNNGLDLQSPRSVMLCRIVDSNAQDILGHVLQGTVGRCQDMSIRNESCPTACVHKPGIFSFRNKSSIDDAIGVDTSLDSTFCAKQNYSIN